MAELDWKHAQQIAGTLITIGHPPQREALDATALDLTKLCKGTIVQDRVLSPFDQALELVEAMRTGWLEGWPQRGGTALMYRLFHELFEDPVEERRPYETPPPPACPKCNDTGWESIERNGFTCVRSCSCGMKRKPASVCPECGGKETRLINGRRQPCHACLSPERRQQIADFLNQQRGAS